MKEKMFKVTHSNAKKAPSTAKGPGSKPQGGGGTPMPKHTAKKVSPSSMKVKPSGPVAPKITSVDQITSFRKKKYGI